MGAGKALLIVFGGIVIIAGIVAGAYAIKYYTADVRGRVEANEIIKSGENRIAQYDHFFNLCASIQANEGQIDALKGELVSATSERNKERINAALAGVIAARAGAIAQYNADAAKNYTDGQFRDSDLPFAIADRPYEGRKTSCAYAS